MIAAAFILLFAANVDELYKRGVEAFERGQAAEAVQVLNQAAELAPDNAQVWKALGVVYASRGDFERAADPFSKACALASQLRDACYFHARNLYALNRFEPSLAVLRKALPYDHSPWRIHLGIAQALEALARPQEAEKEFRIAIETSQSPTAEFDPRLHYAVFLYRQGRTGEALGPAQQVVGGHPGSGRAHYELGRIQYQLGRLGAAIVELEKAVELGYGDAAPMLAKARARLKVQGD